MIEAIDARLDGASQRPIAVAFSNGGDSLALLAATIHYARRVARRVVAITVDHQLSAYSEHWTELARINALQLGADWRACVWTGDKPATGLPAAARQARHTLVAEAARDVGARVILFGHTRDDVIEAAEMRASDTPSLGFLKVWGASPIWPAGRGVALFRPLLNTRRDALRDVLRSAKLTWIDDPANLDTRFARSRARLRLANGTDVAPPSQESTSPDLAAFASAVSFSEWGDARADAGALRTLTRSDALRALGALLTSVSGAEQPPRPTSIQRVLDKLEGETTVAATLVGSLVFKVDHVVRVVREVGDMRSARRDASDVFDGRFLSNSAQDLDWLKGKMRRLDPESRLQLKNIHPRVRPGLPIWHGDDGLVHLAGTDDGKAPWVQSLARARFRLACGVVQRESELDDL